MSEIQTLYKKLLDAWNDQSASGMAELFAEEGEMIGYDGSTVFGREDIFSHLEPIFRDHPTARFISIVKNVRFPEPNVGVLRAIAGMVPRGQDELNPNVNAHQTLIAVQEREMWRIHLFQNTPAQFHGRPELVDRMTAELREALRTRGI